MDDKKRMEIVKQSMMIARDLLRAAYFMSNCPGETEKQIHDSIDTVDAAIESCDREIEHGREVFYLEYSRPGRVNEETGLEIIKDAISMVNELKEYID